MSKICSMRWRYAVAPEARTCSVRLTSPDIVGWTFDMEVGWYITWSFMEWRVQGVLGLPPHRTLVFEAEGEQPSHRQRVGPSLGCRAVRRRFG